MLFCHQPHMYETGLQDGVALELSSNIATKLV